MLILSHSYVVNWNANEMGYRKENGRVGKDLNNKSFPELLSSDFSILPTLGLGFNNTKKNILKYKSTKYSEG